MNDVLPTVNVEGTTGETRFGGADVLGIPHLLERPINVVEVQNGKLVYVYTGWPPRISGDHVAVAVGGAVTASNAGLAGTWPGAPPSATATARRSGGGRRSAGPHRERVWQHR